MSQSCHNKNIQITIIAIKNAIPVKSSVSTIYIETFFDRKCFEMERN